MIYPTWGSRETFPERAKCARCLLLIGFGEKAIARKTGVSTGYTQKQRSKLGLTPGRRRHSRIALLHCSGAKARIAECERIRCKKDRETLADRYVISKLQCLVKLPSELIPQELIELKRAQLLAKRTARTVYENNKLDRAA